MKVSIVAFDDCMASAVVGLLDAFNIASLCVQRIDGQAKLRFEPLIVTADGGSARGFGGFQIRADLGLEQLDAPDIVVVPPALGDVEEILERERCLISWLRSRGQQARILSSVCTGAFFLAEAGLLNSLRATTNPSYSALFHARYPNVPLELDKRVLDHNNIVCAGTTTAFLDLAIYLVDRVAGHDVAVLMAKALSTDKNAASQRPYFLFVAAKDHGDASIVEAQEWLETHYLEPLNLEDLARRVHLSTRSLSRRFGDRLAMPPSEYLRRTRIEAAKRLLETTDFSVEQVTLRVGYEDIRSFCRLFRVATGLTPRDYRKRFKALSFPLAAADAIKRS